MILDLILILIIAGFVIGGYKKGFISSLGSLVGLILTILIMARFYPWLLARFEGGFWVKVLVFILALIIISIIISAAIWLMEKIFKFFHFIPGAKLLNRLLGSAFGLISGLLITSFFVWMLLKLPINDGWLENQLQNSYLIKPLLLIAYIWIPAVPQVYREVTNHVK
ncbi:MAG: CvpA family protein [Patescibacteria group bacterium]